MTLSDKKFNWIGALFGEGGDLGDGEAGGFGEGAVALSNLIFSFNFFLPKNLENPLTNEQINQYTSREQNFCNNRKNR